MCAVTAAILLELLCASGRLKSVLPLNNGIKCQGFKQKSQEKTKVIIAIATLKKPRSKSYTWV